MYESLSSGIIDHKNIGGNNESSCWKIFQENQELVKEKNLNC